MNVPMSTILMLAGTVGIVAAAAYLTRQRATEAKRHADSTRQLVSRAEQVHRRSAAAADDLVESLSGVYEL